MKYILPGMFLALLMLVIGFCPKKSPKIVDDGVIAATDPGQIRTVEKVIPKNNDITRPSSKGITRQSSKDITVQASRFVDYAKTLIGTPYLYGSTDPDKGLDCSGFVNCVSDHFGLQVPRSSVGFTDFGTTIDTSSAKPGDLILFTGTDLRNHAVGHMGIVTSNVNGHLEFIHSSSGHAKGVTISELSGYYESRFVKVIRIFPTTSGKL